MADVVERPVVNESGSLVTLHIGRDMDEATYQKLVAEGVVTPVEAKKPKPKK